MTQTITTPTVVETVETVSIITTSEMIALFMEQLGATFIGFSFDSDMSSTDKMRKGGNPFFGDCRKWQKVSGQVNFIYDEAVLRQLEKEGKSADDFKQGESWHEPVIRADGTLTPLARHKKDPRRNYLRFRLLAVSDMRYYRPSTGETLPTDAVKAFVPEKSNYANQGTEKKIMCMTWGLDDIRTLNMGGKVYSIVPG